MYAGFWIRWIGAVLDTMVLIVLTYFVQFVTGPIIYWNADGTFEINFWCIALGTVIGWIYFSVTTYYFGATIGKMLVGIRVKSEDMNRAKFRNVIIRETIGKMISGITFFVGFLMTGFSPRKQALHDKIAKTVVVYHKDRR